MTGALEWIEGPPDVWTAEIEDTCRYPDDDEPGAFLVSIRSDEDGLRIDVPASFTRRGASSASLPIETDGHLMTDHQAPTIDQILAMNSGELHEWSRGGHTVVTPFGLGTVYNETFLDDQLDGLCVFLEDRSQAFYSREHGWETRDDYVTREEQERAAQRSRRRSRAR